jgi:hypothetical protein
MEGMSGWYHGAARGRNGRRYRRDGCSVEALTQPVFPLSPGVLLGIFGGFVDGILLHRLTRGPTVGHDPGVMTIARHSWWWPPA